MDYKQYINAANTIKRYYIEHNFINSLKNADIEYCYEVFYYTYTFYEYPELWERAYLIMFKKCISCNCCARHSINKPYKLKKWYECPPHNFDQTIYSCMCSCRHLARSICRQID